MTKTRDIQKFYHRLMELKDQGFSILVEDNSYKNYTSYYISKRGNGNAEYKDCVIMYNGDECDQDTENVCQPETIPAEELLEDVESIVSMIKEIFGQAAS